MDNTLGNDRSIAENRAWTLQLYSEFERICYQNRVKLLKPLIDINESQTYWGQWVPHLRVLNISRNLIKGYSWENVLGVLKHEMAHQVVTEIFKRDDVAHGPLFLKACEMLGVPDEYCGSATELVQLANPFADWKTQPISEEESGLLRKVEKLLALANTCNENESFLAMLRVQQLFAKYNIERIQRQQKANERKFVVLTVNHGKRKSDKNQRFISSILTNHYFVNVVFSDIYSAQDLVTYKTMEIMGTRENVLMAEYVYVFLNERVQTLWKQYQLYQNVGAGQKGSYQSGLLTGFREKLDKPDMPAEGEVKSKSRSSILFSQDFGEKVVALEKCEDVQLDAFVKKRFPRTVNTRDTGKFLKEAYDAGRVDGQKITLSKAVHSKSTRTGFLIGPAQE